MPTAKEMFEELGYEKLNTSDSAIGYQKGYDNYIWFYLGSQKYISNTGFNYKRGISLDEHKAIHQQLKELRWLDE